MQKKVKNLQSHLYVYDIITKTIFNLVKTLDYECFYEEDQKKEECLILQDNKLYNIKNIADNFLDTFVDMKNSYFIYTLTSYS